MKTWKRFGYESGGVLYIGSAEQLGEVDDPRLILRIMGEVDFKKHMAEHRRYKRVFDAAMKFHTVPPNTDRYEQLVDLEAACEKCVKPTAKRKRAKK